MKNKNTNNGITLIALVITIIVMLILVAVTINMAVNGGLFEKAGEAVGDTKNVIGREQELANLDANMTVDELIEKYTGGSKEIEGIKVGDFVEYGIGYQDVYKDYTYIPTNGWRLLNYKTDDGGKTIYDVELISTGVPTKLYYYNTSYNATGNNKWWITDSTKIAEFKTTLENHYTKDNTSEYDNWLLDSNIYASAGMYYNLKDIPFFTESNYNTLSTDSEKYNIGWYRSITKGTETLTGNKTGSDIFITSPGSSVRMLTLPEINSYAENGISSGRYLLLSNQEPATGLYILQNINNITGLSGKNYDTGSYWLASPWVWDSNARMWYIMSVSWVGSVEENRNVTLGVRPVVSLGTGSHYRVKFETDIETGMDYYTLTAE